MTPRGEDAHTRWIIAAVGSLLLLALATLAGFDRARIASDATTALAIAQRADKEQALLRAEVAGDIKAVRAQLAQIEEQQRVMLEEIRRR